MAPLPYSEIYAWIVLTGKFIVPEEIDWLIQMDNSWISTVAAERSARREREKQDAEIRKGGK